MELKSRIIGLLELSGFTTSEAKLYLTAHQKPNLTLKELQKLTGLSRATVYRAFENLKERGLIVSSKDNWRKNIAAVSLRSLADKIGKEQRKLRKVELELKQASNLLDLSSMAESFNPVEVIDDRTKCQEKAMEIIHKDWEHFYCHGSAERLMDILGNQVEKDWVKKRYTSGKSVDLILTEFGPYSDEFMPTNERQLRNTKVNIDSDNQNHCTYIFEDEIDVWHVDPDLGNRVVVIQDPAILKSYHTLFKAKWDNL